MTMGMKTSLATFPKLINTVLAIIIGIQCSVYLDDIIAYGKI